jgi:hypothetical protein
MGLMSIQELEARRLVRVGLLTSDMNYRIGPGAVLLTFCNRLEGRMLHAAIVLDQLRPAAEGFEMSITEQVDSHDVEVVSVYRHSSLEHLTRIGKGFLCFDGAGCKAIKRQVKALVTVRVEEELKLAFDEAVAVAGESQAVVLRQLMRFFVGNGPDPRGRG